MAQLPSLDEKQRWSGTSVGWLSGPDEAVSQLINILRALSSLLSSPVITASVCRGANSEWRRRIVACHMSSGVGCTKPSTGDDSSWHLSLGYDKFFHKCPKHFTKCQSCSLGRLQINWDGQKSVWFLGKYDKVWAEISCHWEVDKAWLEQVCVCVPMSGQADGRE